MWEPFFIIIGLMLLLALNVFCVAFSFIKILKWPAEQNRRVSLTLLLVGIALVVLVADWAVGSFFWLVTRRWFQASQTVRLSHRIHLCLLNRLLISHKHPGGCGEARRCWLCCYCWP